MFFSLGLSCCKRRKSTKLFFSLRSIDYSSYFRFLKGRVGRRGVKKDTRQVTYSPPPHRDETFTSGIDLWSWSMYLLVPEIWRNRIRESKR